MKFYIYILHSVDFDKYYVGHSQDPWKRLQQHNSNEPDKFTGKYQPWSLAAVFHVSEVKGNADRIEKFIKKQKSRKLIEKLIDPFFIPDGTLAQLVRVPHVRDESEGRPVHTGSGRGSKKKGLSFDSPFLFCVICRWDLATE